MLISSAVMLMWYDTVGIQVHLYFQLNFILGDNSKPEYIVYHITAILQGPKVHVPGFDSTKITLGKWLFFAALAWHLSLVGNRQINEGTLARILWEKVHS